QPGALPVREGAQRGMRRASDEVEGAVAQRLHGLRHGKQELERRVESLGPEETELHRGDRGKIRIRDQIRNRDSHSIISTPYGGVLPAREPGAARGLY